jgi:anti-sigma B factor antagonist
MVVTLDQQAEPGGTSLSVRGDLDVAAVPKLRFAIRRVLDAPPTMLCVDLTGVSYMRADILGLLAVMARRLRPGGCRVVVHARPRHAGVFRLYGLDRLIHRIELDAHAGLCTA